MESRSLAKTGQSRLERLEERLGTEAFRGELREKLLGSWC